MIEDAGFRAVSYLRPDMTFRASHCMADSGGVTIGPDGSLYPCDHCQPETRYGDIFNGTTDETARREFCRVDKTREKCRTCPFLPDCTSLATCPVEDYHCRQVHELIAICSLKRMVEKKESDHIDGEIPIC